MFFYIAVPLTALCYYIYRKVRGPIYWPGTVFKQATSSPETFDSKSLIEAFSEEVWRMPGDISVHHTSTSSSSEKPTHVVCVHGGPAVAPSSPWKVCASPLLAGAQFHWFHQRGCGQSSRPFDKFPTPSFWPGYKQLEATLGLGAQLGDIERARRRIGAERVSLLGHSFGGFVATLYAAEFPERVSSLVLLTPASMLQGPNQGSFNLFSAMREKLRTEEMKAEFDEYLKRYLAFGKLPSMNEKEAAELHAGFSEHFFRACPDMYYPPEARQAGEDSIGGWAAFATYLSLGIEYDYRAVLKKRLQGARFRTLIVNGKDDIVPVEEGMKFAEIFPEKFVEVVAMDGGHFLPDEKPEELAQIMKDVLIRTGSRDEKNGTLHRI